MGMLAEEGSYDSLDALVQSESLRQTLPVCKKICPKHASTIDWAH